jgi:tungstate transport system permease protein
MESLGGATREAVRLLFTGDAELWSIVAVSFSVSLRAILVAAPVALLVAYVLAHTRFPGRRALVSTFSTLQAVPAVVVGLTVYLLLSRGGPFGDLRLLFTQTAMVIGQILLCFPILVSAGYATFQGADRRIWETARTLGAGPLRALLTTARELRFGLMVGLIAGFGRIIAEVGSSMMVGGNILHYTRNIPTAIALETGKGEFAQGIALGLVLLLLALTLNLALGLVQGRGELA